MRHATPRAESRLRQPQADEVDTRADVLVAARAAEQWGVLSLEELRACGLTRDGVMVRVRNGRLHPLHRGVYAVGHCNPPREGRFLAAVKACGPDGVLSHYSAATLWELVEWDHRRPEVTVPGPGTRLQAGVRVRRSRTLAATDVCVPGGIPVTSPARTLMDLAPVLGYARLRRAVHQALSLRLVGVEDLLVVLRQGRGRRGMRKLARIVASGAAPTRSVLEDAVLDLMIGGGLEPPDVNVPLVLSGRRVIPDFRWPGARLIVEADGSRWHDDPVAREDDAERQALLEAHGERILRVTWQQAIARPAETLARLRAAGAPRVSSSSASG
jgi:hypothetical protein